MFEYVGMSLHELFIHKVEFTSIKQIVCVEGVVRHVTTCQIFVRGRGEGRGGEASSSIQ